MMPTDVACWIGQTRLRKHLNSTTIRISINWTAIVKEM